MYNYNAILLRWIDGDTFVAEVDLGFYVFTKQRIRLARIDTPELNQTVAYRERQANHARAVAKKFCPEGSSITIVTRKQDRDLYSRYIAEAIYNDVNISDYLLEKGVAKPYTGTNDD